MPLARDILIARDPATVFDYIVDPHNLPEWQPDVIEIIADAPRAVAAGFRWQEVRHVFGHRCTATMEVTACQSAWLFYVHSITAPVPFAVSHELATEAQRTRLSLTIDGRLGRRRGSSVRWPSSRSTSTSAPLASVSRSCSNAAGRGRSPSRRSPTPRVPSPRSWPAQHRE